MRGHTSRRVGSLALGGSRQQDWGCFADEVVIDFPSVAPAVDRMRNAFVADERGSVLSAAIKVTRREASFGAVFPLQVPVRCTCRVCGGRGETWAEPCLRCKGTGHELRQHQLSVVLPAGVIDGACFHFSVTPRHHPPTRIELRVLVA